MGLGKAIRRLPVLVSTSREVLLPPPAEPKGNPPPIDFNTIYETFYYNYVNDPARKADRPRGIFHPSSGLHEDTGICKRSLIFELVHAPLSPTSIPGTLCKVLDAGTNRHVGLQKVFKNLAAAGYMGIVGFKEEVHCVHPTLPLSGHMDGLAWTSAGHRYAMDFKTWSSTNCAKTFEPDWKHKIQLNTYMGIYGVRAGYMIYENKDNQKWLGPAGKFRVNYDPKLYSETEQFCYDVLVMAVAKKMPAFDEKICKSNIMFCPYQAVCQQEQDSKVRWDDYDMRDEATKQTHSEAVHGNRG